MICSKTIYVFLFIVQVWTLTASTTHHCDYFQQQVDYRIRAELEVPLNRINATQEVIYTNNSPDTLSSLFFHLYLNKYAAGAYDYGSLRPRSRGSIEIFEVKEEDAHTSIYFVDKTLMQLSLNRDLLPGDSVRLHFKFASKLPPASGRYGYYGAHFDVGNWYPTPVVYDRAGWHLNQHLDNEFYQEWGDFRVDIRVPKGFIVGATGTLLNPEETLSDTSAAVKKWYRENPDDTTTTVWKFRAERVHDFAWTADPDYVLFQSEWNGITFNVLAMDYNAKEWEQVTEFGVEALKFLSETFGDYPWEQVTIADTYIRAGGIEYPMITFINTYISPLYALNHFRAVIIHEMAHNWFYGVLASNQTEEEWMDEGFTTMAEILCMEHLFGTEDNYSYNTDGWIRERLKLPVSIRQYSQLKYFQMAKKGKETDPINLRPDLYLGESYVSQYEKMANVLFMLKNVMGDSLFFRGLRKYYQEWRFKHPYPEDFFRIMEETANRDLDWFFEQWLNTTRTLDYAVKDVYARSSGDNGGSYQARIELERSGDIFMPVDVDVLLKDGGREKYHIPVDLKSKPDPQRRTLSYWHFSQKLYTMTLKLPSEPECVIIDPEQVLLDVNRLNNRSGRLPPISLKFMKPLSYYPPPDSYAWELWPLVFYNDIDKFKLGIKGLGSYLNIDHRLDLGLWLKTVTHKVDFSLEYEDPLHLLGTHADLQLSAYHFDGRRGGSVAITKAIHYDGSINGRSDAGVRLETYRVTDNRYPLIPWSRGEISSILFGLTAEAGNRRQREYQLELWLRNSLLGSRYRFSTVFAAYQRMFSDRNTEVKLKFRISAGYGEGEVPVQHRFRLSGSTAWDQFQHPFYRSRGTLPYPWYRNGNLYHSGYAGVRGSTLLPAYHAFAGNRLLAASADFAFANPLRYSRLYLIRDLQPFLFTDIGSVWNGQLPAYPEFLKSAGFGIFYDRLGLAGTILNIERVQMEFPLWLSHPPQGEDFVDWRWLLHIDMEL